MDLVGIFHSHPSRIGDTVPALDTPSEIDVREAAYPVVHVIWSRHAAEWHARGFRIEDGRTIEVGLLVNPAG